MQVGDKVLYVPHACHAFHQDRLTSAWPWVVGKRAWVPKTDSRGKPVFKDGMPQTHAVVQEMTDEDLNSLSLKRTENPVAFSEEFKLVVPVRPKELWPATVTGVNENGTVNLDVESNVGGVTLHLTVPVSLTATGLSRRDTKTLVHLGDNLEPHTCVVPAKQEVEDTVEQDS